LPLSNLFEVEYVCRELRDTINLIRLSGYHAKLFRRKIEYNHPGVLQWLEHEKALISGSTILSFIVNESFDGDLDCIAYNRVSIKQYLPHLNTFFENENYDDSSSMSMTNKYYDYLFGYHREIDVTSPPEGITLQEYFDNFYDLDFLKNTFDGRRLIISKKNSIRTRSSLFKNPRFYGELEEYEESEDDNKPTLVMKSEHLALCNGFKNEYKVVIDDQEKELRSMEKIINRCNKYESRGFTITNYWSRKMAEKYNHVLRKVYYMRNKIINLHRLSIPLVFILFDDLQGNLHEIVREDYKPFLGRRVLERIKRCEEAIKNGTVVEKF
jgi:hypothetical protein